MRPPPWMRQADCRDHPDPDAWFAHIQHERPRAEQAIDICKACPVRRECFDYAVAERIDHGIWGGQTAAQRCGRGRPQKSITHGTYNGYRIHLYRKEQPCADCDQAATDYDKNRKATA